MEGEWGTSVTNESFKVFQSPGYVKLDKARITFTPHKLIFLLILTSHNNRKLMFYR